MVCSECIQLITEDAVNKKRRSYEEQQQEWTEVELLYLLQLRHSIVRCVCIHMMRDEEGSESHDKVTTFTHSACCTLSLYCQRLGELFQELSVVSDQVHSIDPLIELGTVEALCKLFYACKLATLVIFISL